MPGLRSLAIVIDMGPFIIAATSLVIALAYELPAYVCRFLPPAVRRRRIADIAVKAMDRFVACAKAYIGLELQ